MEGGWSDGREDRGSGRSGESSLDDAMLSTLSIRELKRILNENGVDPIKEGLIERADLVQRARDLELGGSYPSSSPSLLSTERQRGEGAGAADVGAQPPEDGEAVEIDLTPEQAEKVLSFVSVTETETQEARYMLDAMAWDIDAAVGMYLELKSRPRVDESKTGLGATEISAAGDVEFVEDGEICRTDFPISSPAAVVSDARGSRDEGRIHHHLPNEVVQQQPGTSHLPYSGVDELSSTGDRSTSSSCANSAGTSSLRSDRYSKGGFDEDGIRAPLPAVRDILLSDGHLNGNFLAAYDPGGEEEVEESNVWMFPPPEGLSATTSFKHTKVLCERQKRWLLVNIQDPQVIASHNLNRDVWSDDTIRSIIQTFFVFWQRSNTSQQSGEFLRRYHIESNKLPHTSILDPRTGLMLLNIEGYVEKEDMCVMLVDFLEKNQVGQAKAPQLRTVSIGRTSSDTSAERVAEQEESKQGKEYDDQGCQIINVGDDEGSSSSVDVEEVVEEKTAGVETTGDMFLAEAAEPETIPLPPEPSIDAVNVTRVQLKLPDGGKATARRFLKTDSVQLLFQVARSLLPPEHQNRPFDITTNFPPRSLSPLKDKTLSEADVSGAALSLRWVV